MIQIQLQQNLKQKGKLYADPIATVNIPNFVSDLIRWKFYQGQEYSKEKAFYLVTIIDDGIKTLSMQYSDELLQNHPNKASKIQHKANRLRSCAFILSTMASCMMPDTTLKVTQV